MSMSCRVANSKIFNKRCIPNSEILQSTAFVFDKVTICQLCEKLHITTLGQQDIDFH